MPELMPEFQNSRLKVLLTGARGRIGQCLIEGFGERYDLRGFDRQACQCEGRQCQSCADANVPAMIGDLTDFEMLREAMRGVDVVVHLAATKNEAPFVEDLVPNNIIGTYNTFEAARQSGVRRIVFASTVQTVAGYPKGQTIRIADPPRPSTLYGATKVVGESLGRWFHDTHKLEFVAIRIGWFLPYDSPMLRCNPGGRNIWLSPRDAVRLFGCAIEKPDVGYALVFGTSITQFERLSRIEARELLGYQPCDDVAEIEIEEEI